MDVRRGAVGDDVGGLGAAVRLGVGFRGRIAEVDAADESGFGGGFGATLEFAEET